MKLNTEKLILLSLTTAIRDQDLVLGCLCAHIAVTRLALQLVGPQPVPGQPQVHGDRLPVVLLLVGVSARVPQSDRHLGRAGGPPPFSWDHYRTTGTTRGPLGPQEDHWDHYGTTGTTTGPLGPLQDHRPSAPDSFPLYVQQSTDFFNGF